MKKLLSVLLALVLNTGVLFAQASTYVLQDTLIIGIYHSPPFVILDENREPEGVSIWLWENVNRDLNYTYKYKIFEQDSEPLKNLQDELEAGTVDVSVNPLTITSERNEKFEFTYPFFIGNLAVAKHEESNLNRLFSFLSVFSNKKVFSLSMIILGLMTIFGLVMWLLEKHTRNFEEGYHGAISGFWWSAVTMTTVGYGDKVPVTKKGRFIAFMWMILSLVIVAVFTATVTSVLTVDQLTDKDLSMENIKEMEVGTVEASASESYLKRNFFRYIKSYPEFHVGLEALVNGEVDVFIYDEPWLIYEISNNSKYEDLELIPNRFHVQYYAMPVNNMILYPLRDELSSGILKQLETSDWQFLLNEYNLVQY